MSEREQRVQEKFRELCKTIQPRNCEQIDALMEIAEKAVPEESEKQRPLRIRQLQAIGKVKVVL